MVTGDRADLAVRSLTATNRRNRSLADRTVHEQSNERKRDRNSPLGKLGFPVGCARQQPGVFPQRRATQARIADRLPSAAPPPDVECNEPRLSGGTAFRTMRLRLVALAAGFSPRAAVSRVALDVVESAGNS